MICNFLKPEKPEKNINDEQPARVALVVGHTKKSQGAVNINGETEFNFWTDFLEAFANSNRSEKLKYKIFFREKNGSKGIKEAYERAENWQADCLIEFHFNAFNGEVQGIETLCSFDDSDYRFAKFIQKHTQAALKNNDRGVKRQSRSARGGRSTNGYKGPNCLVEPFFGDNASDYLNFIDNEMQYMEALEKALLAYFA